MWVEELVATLHKNGVNDKEILSSLKQSWKESYIKLTWSEVLSWYKHKLDELKEQEPHDGSK